MLTDSPDNALNMGMKAAVLMQMMISYQQQMNLTLLVKMRMGMQQVYNADGVSMSLFLCFLKLHLLFVLDNQDPSKSSLQSDLESDEEDRAVLTAKDGNKWKNAQVGEQSTGRLASHNILKECPGPLSYARRNIQAASPVSAWLLFIDKFILEHIHKCTITEAHRQTKNEEFCRTNNELLAFIAVMYARVTDSNDMPHHTLWNWKTGKLCGKLKRALVKKNYFKESFHQNFTFSPL